MNKYIVPVPNKADVIKNLPFSNVEVLDARPDTSSFGFIKNGTAFSKLVFDNSFSKTYYDYINKNYHLTSTDDKLLILIKELRISKYTNIKGISDNRGVMWSSGCILNAELFLNNNNTYHALYKVDSVITDSSDKTQLEDLIVIAFRTILKKAENKELAQMHIGKTAFTLENIQKHAVELTNFPILKDTILNKGVYRNFNEFKLNKPSIKEYEIQKGKFADDLLVTENGQAFPLQDFWGYCNGNNVFIRSAENLFQMYRTGNTYNVYGFKALKKVTSVKVGNMLALGLVAGTVGKAQKSIRYVAVPTALQLNMNSGELY